MFNKNKFFIVSFVVFTALIILGVSLEHLTTAKIESKHYNVKWGGKLKALGVNNFKIHKGSVDDDDYYLELKEGSNLTKWALVALGDCKCEVMVSELEYDDFSGTEVRKENDRFYVVTKKENTKNYTKTEFFEVIDGLTKSLLKIKEKELKERKEIEKRQSNIELSWSVDN